jgi:hypothetical protein
MDYESYFSTEFSLSKLTTEEYIRSPLFETIMCSFKMDNRETFWVSGPEVPRVLAKIPWAEVAVLSHNSIFDMSILNWIYGISPGFICDTLGMFRMLYPHEPASLANMSRILGLGEKGTEIVNARGKHLADFSPYELQKYGEYCVNDTELTYAAFQKMKADVPLSEMRLIDLTCRLHSEPIFILDKELLLQAQEDEIARKAELMKKVNAEKSVLSSNQQFAELLLSLGVDPPKKLSPAWVKKNSGEDPGEEPVGLIPKGEKAWTYAMGKTDEKLKMMLEGEDPVLSVLVEARMGVKSTLAETRIGRLIGIAGRGTLPVGLAYYGAHTGRFSGSGGKVNLQNLPRSCSAPGCDGGKISDQSKM